MQTSHQIQLPKDNTQIKTKIISFLSQLTSAADLEALAATTQILTSKPEELTAENVTTAAEIVNTLLLSPNATEVQTNTTM